MTEYTPISKIQVPLCNEKHPLSERWKDKLNVTYPTEEETYSSFLKCSTVIPLRKLIEEYIGKGLEEYKHKIPDIINILYNMD